MFDLCDTDGSGEIELSELANLSRSHVAGTTQAPHRAEPGLEFIKSSVILFINDKRERRLLI